MATTYRIAGIPGDGIGKETLPAARRLLDQVAAHHDFRLDWVDYDWGCEYFLRTGEMMPTSALDELSGFDAIFLGAVGAPGVADHISLWGLLIPIRRRFEQYANVRPTRLLEGMESPLRGLDPGDCDFIVVRENVEGEYSEIGGRLYSGTDREMAVQESVFTRTGIERVMRFAFETAGSRRGHVVSATKSNGIIHTMPFWDEVFSDVAADYPDVRTEQYHIDALAAKFVLDPGHFDVVVASNLFGDILTDLAAAVVGSIGIAPSANLNPTGAHPSMFEPVHGSAPDIAGRGIANPVGQIWSGAMMLDHLGQHAAARSLMGAVEDSLGRHEVRTRDMGGTATTTQVVEDIERRLETSPQEV